MLTKVKVVDTWVTTAPYKDYISEILELAAARKSSYVCCANVHMLMEAYQKPAFKQVVNRADIVTPDGRPLSILMNLQYKLKQERACGMDLFPDILRDAGKRGLSVFFYGSTNEVLAAITQKAKAEFAGLRIAGSYSPPFRRLTAEEDKQVVKMINGSGAHLVFVSLGCPKQEKWMYEHKGVIHGCMLGLGQAFLTYAGLEKRLPKWARDLSLEWAYRLYLEPGRLWKRYLVGNSKFLWLAGRSLVLQKNLK
ncbi:WecB/TagA/CpsF family glycosyltransferase [Cesiribacter andamanensis]|uniref:Putative N-acetylmannosaminyltransferase n=1 Tax=Cesiribacter andamanensis AMV16 TaxID=1279009 RepID=M7NZZ9_9BACT|nr:WecB/TagA/CpsF family glycosyltransferase [Cesiribacter andamanensis]EMR03944.1 Putative N-acetylmannosaminyltransferase [Cesiribacter andamanensis AMV16]